MSCHYPAACVRYVPSVCSSIFAWVYDRSEKSSSFASSVDISQCPLKRPNQSVCQSDIVALPNIKPGMIGPILFATTQVPNSVETGVSDIIVYPFLIKLWRAFFNVSTFSKEVNSLKSNIVSLESPGKFAGPQGFCSIRLGFWKTFWIHSKSNFDLCPSFPVFNTFENGKYLLKLLGIFIYTQCLNVCHLTNTRLLRRRLETDCASDTSDGCNGSLIYV